MTTFRPTDGTGAARLTFAVDLLALALFVIAGMRSHAADGELEVFARTAIPLGLAWVVTATAVGAYRPPVLPRLLLTWAVAVPVGVVLRAWWTDSPEGSALAVFGVVALAFTLAFLAVGRFVTAIVVPRLGWRGTPAGDPRPQ